MKQPITKALRRQEQYDARKRWALLHFELERVWTALRDVAGQLPEVPADGRCPECGHDDAWSLVQSGYVREWTVSVEYQEDGVTVDSWWWNYNGSEDWSYDADGPKFLQCQHMDRSAGWCGATFAVPDNSDYS